MSTEQVTKAYRLRNFVTQFCLQQIILFCKFYNAEKTVLLGME